MPRRVEGVAERVAGVVGVVGVVGVQYRTLTRIGWGVGVFGGLF